MDAPRRPPKIPHLWPPQIPPLRGRVVAPEGVIPPAADRTSSLPRFNCEGGRSERLEGEFAHYDRDVAGGRCDAEGDRTSDWGGFDLMYTRQSVHDHDVELLGFAPLRQPSSVQ